MREVFNQIFHYEGDAPGPMSSKLEAARVVAFRSHEDGIVVEECCDGAFAAILTADEIDELIAEIRTLKPRA